MASKRKFNTEQALQQLLEMDYDASEASSEDSEMESDSDFTDNDLEEGNELPVIKNNSVFLNEKLSSPKKNILPSKLSVKKVFSTTPSKRRDYRRQSKTLYFHRNIIDHNDTDEQSTSMSEPVLQDIPTACVSNSKCNSTLQHEIGHSSSLQVHVTDKVHTTNTAFCPASSLHNQHDYARSVETSTPVHVSTFSYERASKEAYVPDPFHVSETNTRHTVETETELTSSINISYEENSQESENIPPPIAGNNQDMQQQPEFSIDIQLDHDDNSDNASLANSLDNSDTELHIEDIVNPPPVHVETHREPFERPPEIRPIECFPGDRVLQEDEDNGWFKPISDDIPLQGEFIEENKLTVDMEQKEPEDFFQLLFDERMFQTIAEQTNIYARQRIRRSRQGRDPVEQMMHPDNQRHNRLTTWQDVNASDIKIFMAHVIIMSNVRKSAVHAYWSTNTLSQTPFFGKYLSRNRFQTILWHLHMNDTSTNPPPGCINHDPLARVRNVIEMARYNFRRVYNPGANVAVDESGLGYRGRVFFLQFNSSKPHRFFIKLFMVSEKTTGYMVCFSVYTGSQCNELTSIPACIDPDCSVTTKTVMGLLQMAKLLDSHRRIWFDNWYTSCELMQELLYRDTYAAGTVRSNRKFLPKAVVSKSVKLQKGESVFRRNGHMLCIKWCDKRPVIMLSTIHAAEELKTKTRYNGEDVIKPHVVHEYNTHMNSVDHSDHFLSAYVALKGNKWYRKLFLHLFNMIVLNSYILNRKYGNQKLSHAAFREYIANYLITTSVPTATCTRKRNPPSQGSHEGRLGGKHFPVKFPLYSNAKRKYPAKRCKVCNFTKQQRDYYNKPGNALPVKYTTFMCDTCPPMAMCVTPCFAIYHTELQYRRKMLELRLSDNV